MTNVTLRGKSDARKQYAWAILLTLGLGIACPAQAMPFSVDFSKEIGTIKRLNGICNAPPISNTNGGGIEKEVAALEVPFFRFHDAALENPGYALVDISRIFPLFHLDPDDERNYDFEATDDYIRSCVESGAQIDFRLGESIEHASKNYRVNPPKDFAKWAEICVHVIRHFNEGWANGHRWNIRYWSIWEEPDNDRLLTGDSYESVYFPLYLTTARRIKSEFPALQVGGPNCMGPYENLKKFVDFCAMNAAPLDFLSWTHYTRSPKDLFDGAVRARGWLDSVGYAKTKIGISEWHLAPVSWDGHGRMRDARHVEEWRRSLTGTSSAVYIAAVLSKMQDSPIDAMFFYSMKTGTWGAFDLDKLPRQKYWALKAFAELAHGETRVAARTEPEPGWYLLASKERSGRGHVLLSALRAEGVPYLALVGGVKPVSVKVIDTVRNLESVKDWEWNGKTLKIPRLYGESCVWLIETEASDERDETGMGTPTGI